MRHRGEILEWGPEDQDEEHLGDKEESPRERRDRVKRGCFALLRNLYPEEKGGGLEGAVGAVIDRAYLHGEKSLSEADALEEANGFSIPRESVAQDASAWLECAKDLGELRRRKLRPNLEKRLCHARIDKWVNVDNPELKRLRWLVDGGMNLFLEEGFSPNGVRGGPKLSPTYLRMHTAVNKAFYQGFWAKGLAILLDKAEAVEHVDRFHLCRCAWALKQDTPEGRPITDPSTIEKGQRVILNSKYSKKMVDEKMGKIEHPTLDQLMAMIGEFYLEGVKRGVRTPCGRLATWEDVSLWKMDFKGAFTLLNFSLESTRAMAVEMTDDLVMIFLCGIFGWTGTPMNFQVVTRTVLWEMSRPGLLQGLLKMFSDDLMGVCWAWNVEGDMTICREFCEGLMGEGSIKRSKDIWGRKVDFIGYSVNLDEGMVGITDRNINRAIYGFMQVELDKPVTVRLMQRLASWGSRYANICRFLLPMVRVLDGEYMGKAHVGKWLLSPGARVAIRMFQVLVVALGARSATFGRKIRSFWGRGRVGIIGEYDASLEGIGLIWYLVDEGTGAETPVGVASQSLLHCEFGDDSSFQNTVEYMGALLAILGVIALGYSGREVGLRGDSVSSLQWVKKGKARSALAMPTAFAHTRVVQREEIMIQGLDHISGTENWRADGLSRGKDGRWLADEDPRFQGLPVVGVNWKVWTDLCDPRQGFDTEEDFIRFWDRMKGVQDVFYDNIS